MDGCLKHILVGERFYLLEDIRDLKMKNELSQYGGWLPEDKKCPCGGKIKNKEKRTTLTFYNCKKCGALYWRKND